MNNNRSSILWLVIGFLLATSLLLGYQVFDIAQVKAAVGNPETKPAIIVQEVVEEVQVSVEESEVTVDKFYDEETGLWCFATSTGSIDCECPCEDTCDGSVTNLVVEEIIEEIPDERQDDDEPDDDGDDDEPDDDGDDESCEVRPGYGWGDRNHCHFGPPGQGFTPENPAPGTSASDEDEAVKEVFKAEKAVEKAVKKAEKAVEKAVKKAEKAVEKANKKK
jgi:hypothetical protein